MPESMLGDLRLRYESTPEVRELRTRQDWLKRNGRYIDALRIGKAIEDAFPTVIRRYMDKAEAEVMTLDTEVAKIPAKDKDELMETAMVLFMACDIIDTAVLDLNDVLKRTMPDCRITTFDDIQQVSDMARKKLKYLQETGDYMKDLVWAEKCDNLYDMAHSKARSIIRKRRESKDWGVNAERLAKGT